MAASSDGDLCVWVFRILIICMVPVLYGPLLGNPLIQPMPDNSTTEATDFRDAWLPDFMGLEGKLAMHRHIKSEIKKRNFEALRLKDGWNTPFDTALWRGKWSANPFILSKELWHPIDFTKPRHLRPWLRLQWLQRGSLKQLKQPQPKIRWWLPTCCDSTPKVSHGAPSDASVPTRT